MTEFNDDGPVMIAYDGSDSAKAGIARAGEQLRSGRSAIVLTVWEPLDSVPFWGAPMAVVPNEITEKVADQAEKVAAEGVALADAAGFHARALVERGDPAWAQIVETAEREQAAVIVLGSHGRSSIGYAAIGSVATAVAHHAKVPVLIVREP